MKISNRNARTMVQNSQRFEGSHTYGAWIGKEEGPTAYVVYSYGMHWPLFIKFETVWYENSDKYSVTTSKHKNQLHPLVETIKKSRKQMQGLIAKVVS